MSAVDNKDKTAEHATSTLAQDGERNGITSFWDWPWQQPVGVQVARSF